VIGEERAERELDAASGTEAAAPRTFAARNFSLALGVIVLVAFVWRVVYVASWGTLNPTGGDGFYYHQQAILLADGHGFANPFVWHQAHQVIPTAQHPPLYSIALAIGSWFGASGFFAQKVISCLIGAAAVGVIGLVGRRVGGPRAGLVAAVVAAAYPNLWVIDGLILSEGLFALTIGVTILAAYRFHDQPSFANAVLVGFAIALAALTRGEGILLVVILGVPLVIVSGKLTVGKRVALFGVIVVATATVIAPWFIRNVTTFERPVYSSTGADDLVETANCDETYNGAFLGFWYFQCATNVRGDESVRAEVRRERGFRYMREHKGELPKVIGARVGRMWEVYRPWQNARFATIEGRPLWAAQAGLVGYWILVPLAIIGGIVTYRRGVTLVPLVAQIVLATVTAITAYGIVRFRLPAEVVLAALAGVALDASWTRFRSRSGSTDVGPSRMPRP
jgi:4-amino-4-deoxy-L-arabinose transferase-like glycosyltransferase